MSMPIPAHLLDVVGSAAATTREAAGGLLHDAVSAVHGRRHRSRRRAPAVAAAVLLAVGVAILVRRRFGTAARGVGTNPNMSAEAPSTQGRNPTMTQHTDDLKGRIKEAAGALSDNDELQADGKRDQQAAKAKQAVEKARDTVNDGIDAVKEKLTKS